MHPQSSPVTLSALDSGHSLEDLHSLASRITPVFMPRITLLLFPLLLTACAATSHRTAAKPAAPQTTGIKQKGIASWYGSECRRTASGEPYRPSSMTAAHRTLPFNSQVRVTSIRTGKSVVLRINNRGPYTGGRIIDVSKAAAVELGMIGSGIAKVELEVLSTPPAKPKRAL